MFDSYVRNQVEKPRRKWVWLTMTFSATAYGVAGLALVVWSFWKIEKLSPKSVPVSFSADRIPTAAPAPAPPPLRKSSGKTDPDRKPRKVVSNELLQPKDSEQKANLPEPSAVEDDGVGSPYGVEGGDPNGVEGAVGDGVDFGGGGPATAPPPPMEVKPQNLPVTVIEKARIAGNRDIQPSGAVLQQMAAQNLAQLVVAVKLCLDGSGVPSSITFARRSGFPEYDSLIESEMMQWRYRPQMVNGRAVPVCTVVNFIIQRE